MSNLLKEILDMVALPFKWIDEERAIFRFNGLKFGIYVEYLEIELPTRLINVANISFGIIKNTFNSANDLDTTITNFGKPRTILSTVAEACLANNILISSDIISLAAADQAKDKRMILYSLAASEIKNKLKIFRGNDIRIKTANETKAFLLSKINFSEEEQEIIKSKLNLDKI